MAPIARGFRGRRPADPSRLPPGQYETNDFPVLAVGPTPRDPVRNWGFAIRGAVDVRVVVSARTRSALLYADELDAWPAAGVPTHVALTREGGRRLDHAQLAAAGPEATARAFVCGPTAFVEHTTRVLLEFGHEAARIRAERFGGAT